MERRIAAVLAADMVGFSRLIERDEVGTLKRQKRHLKELIEPTIVGKNGRIVKLTGDGLIAEFSSVVEAVQCAVSVQAEMAAREEDFPEDEKIQYRVAVHLGDVVFDEGDVYGDGVNVAARLEGLAAPGGVVVSGTAYDVLKANVDVAYKSLGEKQLKNIATPVRVYQVVEGVPIAPAARPSKRVPWVAAAVVVLAMLGGLLWWLQRPDFEPLNPEELAFALPDKPSIAVLAFDNLSGDPSLDYLADGLSEAIIAALGQHPKLFVIARNSSFTYKGKATKVQTIAEEMGVRYVLEGSFQVADDKLRVTAQLVDALDGKHLWTDVYQHDLSTKGLFETYDDILENVVVALDQQLISTTAKDGFRDAGDLQTYSLIGQALAEFQKFTPESNHKAEIKALAALERNPDSTGARTILAWIAWYNVLLGIDPAEQMRLARRYAEEVLEREPQSSGVHSVLSWLDLFAQDYDAAIAHADKSLKLDPAGGATAFLAGWVYSASGDPIRGAELLQLGMRTEPFYPIWVPSLLARSYMMMGQFEESAELLQAVYQNDQNPAYATALAVSLVKLGNLNEAKEIASKIRKTYPTSIATDHLRFFGYIRDKDYLAMYTEALIAAGMPETPPAEPEETLVPQKDKRSIAVLPFENLSGDPDQEYFADGITEDLITDMSKLSGLLVIARNSTFAYKSRSVPIDEIAKELGVRYVLEGSVRRSGDQVRINAKLIDARTKINLWAERYDGALANVFALQDEVTRKIVSALSVTLTPKEQESLNEAYEVNPEAYDLYLRGQSLVNAYSPQSSIEARDYLKRAIALDPSFGRAYAGLALSYAADATFGWSGDPAIAQERAIQYARKALALNSSSPQIYITLAQVYGSQRNLDAGIEEVERAIALDPNFADAYVLLGMFLSFSGKPDEGIQSIRKAMELSPQHGYIYPYGLAVGYFVKGQYDEAIAILESVLERNSNFQQGRLLYIAILGLLDRTDNAEWEAEEVLAALPDFSIAEEEKRVRYVRAEDRERYVSGLRKAGLPE